MDIATTHLDFSVGIIIFYIIFYLSPHFLLHYIWSFFSVFNLFLHFSHCFEDFIYLFSTDTIRYRSTCSFSWQV